MTNIEYEGFEQEDTLVITSDNIQVAIVDGDHVNVCTVKHFSLEFGESEYTTQGDLVVINPAKINLTATGINHNVEKSLYDGLETVGIEGKKIVLKKVYVQNLQFKSVPSCQPTIIPTESLTMYLDEEKEEYDHLNNYLQNDISDSIPITLEVDMAFPEDIELCNSVVTNFFKKNLTRLHIVMEMQEDGFIDHLYTCAKESKTLKEIMPIFHQDCEKVIDLVNNTPQVQQYIIDMRIPLEDQKEAIKDLFRNDKNNKFVLRDLHEWLLEFRFPSSFEINPAH